MLIAVAVALIVGSLEAAHAYWRTTLPPVMGVENVLDSVQVAGRQGAVPVLTLLSPVEVDSSEVQQLVRGEGRVVEENTPVLLSISSFDGATGENLNEDAISELLVASANADELGQTLSNLVIDSPEGSRFLVARRLVDRSIELNIVDILYTIARGAEVDSEGPLHVKLGDLGPAISHTGNPPDETTVQTLIEGSGPQVQLGDQIVAQYLAVTWTDGRVVASTWDAGRPRLLAFDDIMPGLRDAIVDQRIGSRLAITITADMGTGEDTLCLVVDILGTMSSSGSGLEPLNHQSGEVG